MLTFDQIKELIQLVADNDLDGVSIERSGFKVTIEGQGRKIVATPASVPAAQPPAAPAAAVESAPPGQGGPAAPAAEGPEDSGSGTNDGAHIVTSPIVGTFYSAPNPDADPYVRVGDRVKVGQALCIVEAMKLMNEIESDVSGVVVEMLPKNAQPVEFGEPLFAIQAD